MTDNTYSQDRAKTPGVAAAGGSPFVHASFTVLWLATVMSNVGTWMHDVGAGWLMTSLAPSPLLVALVQTATTLPVFLFALPAGALADIVDRRRLLLVVQLFLAITAGALGVLALIQAVTPWILLGFTFLMGIGAALTAPAWQAIVPSLVPRSSLQQAVAANSVGVNISRAIGPALAGVLITTAGIAMPFLINALSYLLVIAALLWWRPPQSSQRTLPPEALLSAIGTGLRYAWHSAALKTTLVRAVAFFVFASAYWALLPLIVRQLLGGGAQLYGVMLGCVGVGAVAGALLLAPLRRRLGPDRAIALGTLGTAATLAVLALTREPVLAAAICLIAGASWITVLATLNVAAQTALPDWVRARGLSIFVTVFFGAQSAGSLLWGQTAVQFGIPAALLIAAACAVTMIPLTWHWKLHAGAGLDLTPSMHWPEPIVGRDVDGDRGPVMITVEYHIEPARAPAFVDLMHRLSEERRRDGAYAWGLFEDTAAQGRYLEYFLVSSWLEHLRQHQRVTRSDQDVQAQAQAFHVGDGPPRVAHYISSVPGSGEPREGET